MTLKECYTEMNGDLEDALRRLELEDRVKRFLLRFPQDNSFNSLSRAMEERDIQAAYRAAHTLKGVCLNLSLAMLADSSSALTKALKDNRWIDKVSLLYETVSRDYKVTVEAISRLEKA